MAKRKVIWTARANMERKAILEYWIDHNQSKTFSVKLNHLFKTSLKLLASNPTIGRKTQLKNIRVKLVREYLLFYEIFEKEIVVLTIWDGRREPEKLKLKT